MMRHSRFVLLFALGMSPFILGTSCPDIIKPVDILSETFKETVKGITDSLNQNVDKINQTMSQAVQTLGEQSASWQSTLSSLESSLASDAGGLEQQLAHDTKDLESQVAHDASDLEKQTAHDVLNLEHQVVSDVHDLINQVDYVVKDGAQFTQESFNCQLDIFNAHARVALQNALIQFLNKRNYQGISNRTLQPFTPIICSANPNGINVAKWDLTAYLVLSGTDLNMFQTQEPSVVVVRSDGSELTVASVGNRVTNYRFEVNVPVMISQNKLKDGVQLQVRWNGAKVNNNQIPIISCGGNGQPCCRGSLCDTGTCANDICGACGANGQPCCAGSTCQTGACVDNVCRECGGINQPCCNGSACGTGRCVSNICTACGGLSQPCCAGSTCNTGQCVSNICTPCGGLNQTCCNGSTCNTGRCVNSICTVCGGNGQACCTGGTCDSGKCISGVCTVCGGNGQACCNGSTCDTGKCINNLCTVCGGVNQACCGGSTCDAGTQCSGGICAACGGVNQPCCGGQCSASGTVCTQGICKVQPTDVLPAGSICGLGHTDNYPRPTCAGNVIDRNVSNGNCPAGWSLVQWCDLGGSSGHNFFGCMLLADTRVTTIPAGLLCGYGHSLNYPNSTCAGRVPTQGCPPNFQYAWYGDLGAPGGQGFFGCIAATSITLSDAMPTIPQGTVCGLSHTCSASQQHQCSTVLLQSNNASSCPSGYSWTMLGDRGASSGEGQFTCSKR